MATVYTGLARLLPFENVFTVTLGIKLMEVKPRPINIMQLSNVICRMDCLPPSSQWFQDGSWDVQSYLDGREDVSFFDDSNIIVMESQPEKDARDQARSKETQIDEKLEPKKNFRSRDPFRILEDQASLSHSHDSNICQYEPDENEITLQQKEPIPVEEISSPENKRSSVRFRTILYSYEFDQMEEESSEEFKVKTKKISGNETKNIPKNFGKAIISFIQRNREKVSGLLQSSPFTYDQILDEFKTRKKNINTIAELRGLWTHGKFSREMRILSNLFLRKHALEYIFNSRVTNYASHIKYRKKLREALKDPNGFTNIKDY